MFPGLKIVKITLQPAGGADSATPVLLDEFQGKRKIKGEGTVVIIQVTTW